MEYTDCLLDKNRLRKCIAELQANLEQQQRELEKEREKSREKMQQSSPCLHCVSLPHSNTSIRERSFVPVLQPPVFCLSSPQSHLSLCSEDQCYGPCCSLGPELRPQTSGNRPLLRKVLAFNYYFTHFQKRSD